MHISTMIAGTIVDGVSKGFALCILSDIAITSMPSKNTIAPQHLSQCHMGGVTPTFLLHGKLVMFALESAVLAMPTFTAFASKLQCATHTTSQALA